jgi:hypothetical protein
MLEPYKLYTKQANFLADTIQGQDVVAPGDRRWLIRVYLGRDHETKKRNYHSRTIHGSLREAQAYLTKKLRERDLGRDSEGAKVTLNEYLGCKVQRKHMVDGLNPQLV